MFENLDLTSIQDENARELIGRLLNLVEKLSADLRDAQAEIQRLRDENNRLKGEQGKPKIKGNTAKSEAADHSSEKERHKTRQRHKSSKKASIHIDREQVLEVDPAILPEDAEYKGCEDVVVQDICVGDKQCAVPQTEILFGLDAQSYQANCPAGTAGSLGRASRHWS